MINKLLTVLVRLSSTNTRLEKTLVHYVPSFVFAACAFCYNIGARLMCYVIANEGLRCDSSRPPELLTQQASGRAARSLTPACARTHIRSPANAAASS